MPSPDERAQKSLCLRFCPVTVSRPSNCSDIYIQRASQVKAGFSVRALITAADSEDRAAAALREQHTV